ncbi:amp dependent CoA ligase [Calocera viscosa TUFC12733]|uniref:Amp dependent CoA ligase n=1 Tax=Calocera viscosa (strain TUFC12733) TaxID=1330018 RepID=A0A167IEU1_CALVF|nr:amp dependent CoA ligase [Calocera viscosa TUFC12733]
MPNFEPTLRLPYQYPRHLTVPQFVLDEVSHPLRPSRLRGSPWLIDDASGRAYGSQEIRERVERLARAVKERWAVGAGDVVCLYSPNHIDYPIVIWAMHRLGCTVSCANPAYTSGELEYQLRETAAKLLFTSTAALEVASKAWEAAGAGRGRIVVFSPPPPDVLPTVQQLVSSGWHMDKNYLEPHGHSVGDSVAFLGFSSGTTGLPKAVAVAHRNVVAVMLQIAAHHQANAAGGREERWMRPGDLVLAVLPFYHIYGLVAIMHAMIFAGGGIVIVQQFHPQQFLETIVRRRITHLPLVPPIVVLLLKSPMTKKYDLSHIRWVVCAAAPISEQVLQEFRALLPRAHIGMGYGLTETTTLVSLFDMHRASVAGSSGFLVPDTVARIVQPDGRLADPGEPGEIWVKGPQMALGYSNNKQVTEETFLPDGWVRTGDEGFVGKDGSLHVVDRLKELIKVSGFQVAPAELEGHLLLHPYVQDAGVVGVPDDYKGEVPLAFVVLKEPLAQKAASGPREAGEIKQELRKWVSDQKVRYKWLEGGVEFVHAIPKNPSGKILRRLLRDQAKAIVDGRQKKRNAKL